MARFASARWDALPYAVGAFWIAFFSVELAHVCSLGNDPTFPHVARGTARFHYCYATAPTHPWLLVVLVSGATLVAGAIVLRGRRFLAWALVGALILAMFIFEVHVQSLNQYRMRLI